MAFAATASSAWSGLSDAFHSDRRLCLESGYALSPSHALGNHYAGGGCCGCVWTQCATGHLRVSGLPLAVHGVLADQNDLQGADADPMAYEDKWIPARILLANAGSDYWRQSPFAGAALTQVSVGPPLLVPEDRLAEMLARFHRGLLLSIPVGTAAALGFYWLSWPSGEE